MMKKLLCFLCTFMLLLPLLPACAEDTRAFTDSLGRTVTVPAVIDRIAVTGPLGQITILAIGADLLCGLTEEWEDTELPYMPDYVLDLPVLGQVYGGKGEMNLEELLKADPQVVIDIGEPKEGVDKDMDDMMEQTGIPWVHISAYINSLDQTYTLLGELLGREEQAKALSDYCANTYAAISSMMENTTKKPLLYVLGEQGLNVLAKGSYHSAILDMMADNLAVVDHPLSKGTGNEVDMEQMLLWNPETVIFGEDSIYDTVADDPLWQSITAIQRGTFYAVPIGPFDWMGLPPSVQRLLGMLWLGKLLYPEEAPYDLYTEVAHYFELFYQYPLTQAEYDKLMHRSLPR